ncbi:MAG: hypothetical protein FJX52_05415, partial [Alphaproteobacteria bacterium]|nr:hypothetical protein [Alphaproteobacteria bacterium]
MALQSIEQLRRPTLGFTPRPAGDGDIGFSDVLRRSIDRAHEAPHEARLVERRLVPRQRPEA